MKLFNTGLVIIITFASLNSFAAAKYECEFTGFNYILTVNNDSEITLSNQFRTYNCEKGVTSFPGTEIDMTVINCKSKNDEVTYYYTEYSDNEIILSRNIVLAKNISCLKIQ
jgi:hypothetical protein